jgi:hypothetical protein
VDLDGKINQQSESKLRPTEYTGVAVALLSTLVSLWPYRVHWCRCGPTEYTGVAVALQSTLVSLWPYCVHWCRCGPTGYTGVAVAFLRLI